MPMTAAQVRRAGDRFATNTGWLDSKHSFSFGQHYDPANTHHGLLLAHNEDVVEPGTGFDTHPHRDVEIVTWVLRGSLVHQDSEGHSGVIYPGAPQLMSAGTGIRHSERNDPWPPGDGGPPTEPVRFVQMWVLPDERDIPPEYQQRDVSDALRTGELVPVASGMAAHRQDVPIRIHNHSAALHAARLAAGHTVSLPEAPFLHLFVPTGRVVLEGVGELSAGDAARLTATGGQRVTAGIPAEILLWEMHATLT
jgi:quercetin 2,3-dioxygenase